MDDFVVVNGKKLRKGYTTGSCAAGASKAAVSMLVHGGRLDRIGIDTPSGVRLELPVTDVEVNEGRVKCSVVKDGGDDPDVTSGLKIFAEAVYTGGKSISIKAGPGIGTVTQPGLKVQVGKPAINPGPMSMILKEVREVLKDGRGVEITLSVPGGEAAAEKTYNSRLGIVGGISIIGTSGIVTPMSEEAWKEAIAVELSVARAKGFRDMVFTFGNYGESFAVNELGMEKERIVKVSNFIGYMLDKAVEYELERVLLVGHLGKLVKVAAGIFHTHSRVADARMEILTAYAGLEGAAVEVLDRIYQCRTTEAAAQIIKEQGLEAVFDRIVRSASERCGQYAFNRIKTGTVLFNEDSTLLGMDEGAKEILRHIQNGDGV